MINDRAADGPERARTSTCWACASRTSTARPRWTRIQASCEEFAAFAGAQLSFHQSNHEGELVDLIQSARHDADAIIINPAAYSFTSIAMFDALKIFEGPIIEVHISNIHARDELHRHSKLSAAVRAVICGHGAYGYIVGMQAALQIAGQAAEDVAGPDVTGPH